jgi:glycosyltransferase involved in cell wall biosynthesis
MTIEARALSASTARPQRVLMVIDHLEVGGAQRHVALLTAELVEQGHAVHVVYTGKRAVNFHPAAAVVPLLSERVVRREEPALNVMVARYAGQMKPTVVHSHLYAAAIAAAGAAAQHSIPLVVSHHSAGTWQEETDRTRMLRAVRGAAYHFAASPHIESRLVEEGIPRSRVEFLPNAVPVPPRPVRSATGEFLRVGFLGRFDTDKDPVLAVEALAHAHALGSQASLEMRGGGPLEKEIRAAVNRFGMEKHVSIGPFLDDVASFYSRIDALLLSSRSEGMPLVVLEAMGNELPVIATRVGAVPLEVRDGVTGLLAEAGAAAELGEAMAWLEAHPTEQRRMGKAARGRLRRLFSVERMASRTTQAYDWVTRSKQPQARIAT